ncbi:MAG: Hsp20/alpha crystallin family protein [Fidelibacterota bacterium]
MTLVKWNPRRNLLSEWDRFLNDFFADGWDNMVPTSGTWVPETDIRETKDDYIVTADLPGLTKKDINISLKEDVLTISGERKFERKDEDDSYFRMERNYGMFNRSFRLPDAVKPDKISAKFKDGVLTVHIPKAEEVKPKQIEIKVQ